jgi:putative transposase
MIDYWQKLEHSYFYHIYNHSGSGKNIFQDNFDNIQFLIGMKKYLNEYMNIYAFCLMPNHFHVLVSIKRREEIDSSFGVVDSNAKRKYLKNEIDINQLLEDQFRRWFSSYALKYNYKYKDRGQLFLKRFKRIRISEEFKFEYMLCYIHHNPIHHKFRSNFKSWKYSSYNYYVKNIASLLNKSYVLERLGSIEVFIELHKNFKKEIPRDFQA